MLESDLSKSIAVSPQNRFQHAKVRCLPEAAAKLVAINGSTLRRLHFPQQISRCLIGIVREHGAEIVAQIFFGAVRQAHQITMYKGYLVVLSGKDVRKLSIRRETTPMERLL